LVKVKITECTGPYSEHISAIFYSVNFIILFVICEFQFCYNLQKITGM